MRESRRLHNQVACDQTNILKFYKEPFWASAISEIREREDCKNKFNHPPPPKCLRQPFVRKENNFKK